MARFGLLILNQGNWNGNQIMTDPVYFNQMVNTSQNLNESYGYLWWLNGKSSFMVPSTQIVFNGSFCPNAPDDMFAGIGKGGQFLNVVPSQNLVFVRMGEAPNGLNVPYLMNDKIWEYINDLACNLSVNSIESMNPIQLFPNPATDVLHLKSTLSVSSVAIVNTNGQIIKSIKNQSNELNLFIGDLPNGFYFVKTQFEDGNSWVGKFTKN